MRARKAAGLLLVAGGALALGTSAATWARAAHARDQARTAWEEREARRVVDAAHAYSVGGTTTVAPAPRSPVARLRIPRVALDEVVVEGVDRRALEAGPGHVPQSPLPGARGNAVLSAHRDRHFSRLDEVAIGDTIVTESDAGRVTWVVAERRVVDRDARPIRPSDEPRLTLTTCWPVRYLGPAPDRLILTARPVGTELARR